MTDMRDFASSNEVRAESAFVDTGAPEAIAIKESYTLDDSGGLGEFHRPVAEEESSNRGPILGALALALMLGGAGAIAYSMYGTGQATDENAQTAEVVAKAPPAPVVEETMTPPVDAVAPATAMAPAAAPVTTPAPAPQRVANTPRVTAPPVAPAMTPAPAPVMASPAPAVDQASAIPEAVSPAPPASAVAGTPLNQQSATPEPEVVTPAAPAEAAPAAPVPEAAPAQPATPVEQSQ